MLTLVGDVGGTNCRFALAHRANDGAIALSQTARLSVADFASFNDALDHYLSGVDAAPTHAAFALAGPKFDGAIKMTNLNWEVSEADLQKRFGFDYVWIANDFAAMARGAAVMDAAAFQLIIDGKMDYTRPVAVLGPGTGLGVAGILPGKAPMGGAAPAPYILSTEGGYSAFAPQDAVQVEILNWLMKRFDFAAAEHVLSGPGLLRIYQALCDIRGQDAQIGDRKIGDGPINQPSAVMAAAEAEPDSLARDAVIVFCNILGGFAGNTAYTLGASGGVIIAGGVARYVAPFIAASDFENRFKARGRASWFTQNIPVRLLTAHSVALYGAAAFISDKA